MIPDCIDAPKAPVFDPRFEKYGWNKELMEYVSDYGITLGVEMDARGRESLHMTVEFAHMGAPNLTETNLPYGMTVDFDPGSATTKIIIPQRYVVGQFAVAIASIQVKRDPKNGNQYLDDGPVSAHRGIFFFHILNIDDPKTLIKFSFRSDFSDEDITRRETARKALTLGSPGIQPSAH